MATGTDQLPHDDAAERRVLGAVLLSGDPFAARAMIDAEDIYRDSHRAAFWAMLELDDAGEPIDMIGVTELLRRDGVTDAATLLAGCLDEVPTAVDLERDAGLVAEAARRRRIIEAAERLRTGAVDPAVDADELVRGLAELAVGARARGWPDEPTPLTSMPELSPFPVEALPGWLGRYVNELSRFSQTPPGMAGLLSLAVMSAAARGRYDVECPRGHREPLILYAAAVARPAERKSSVFASMTRPIRDWERGEADRLAPVIADEQIERGILEKRVEHLRTKASKIDDPDERLDILDRAQRAQRELTERPATVLPRVIFDDVTMEELASQLAAQGGRGAILSSEGGIFDLAAGLYGDGRVNLDLLLKGHDAEPKRINRRGRDEHIERACLTLGLTVQPDVLERAGENRQFIGRGLLARFLFTVPTSTIGTRSASAEPPSPTVEAEYIHRVRELVGGAPDEVAVLRCSPKATGERDRFFEWVEGQYDHDDGVLDQWRGKLVGTTTRIAGLFHLGEQGADACRVPLDGSTMARAIELGRYLLTHAEAVLRMMRTDPRIAAAQRCLRWIEAERPRTFTAREMFEGVKGTLSTMDELRPAVATLVEHGYIREVSTPKPKGRGRRPTPRYEVHPLFADSHNSHKRHSANSANCESGSATKTRVAL
jgi:hypothetical protein